MTDTKCEEKKRSKTDRIYEKAIDVEPSYCCPRRLIIAGMGLWMAVMSYTLSSNMSVAIVCMARPPLPTSVLFNNITRDESTIKPISNSTDETGMFNTNFNSTLRFNDSNTDDQNVDKRVQGYKYLPIRADGHSSHSVFDHTENSTQQYRNVDSSTNSEDESSSSERYSVAHKTTISINNKSPCEITLKQDNLYQETIEFTWDKVTQSYVLSGFYYGYAIAQIPFGWLTGRFGGRHIIGTCITLVSLITLLIPLLAPSGVFLVVVARVCIGMLSGAFSPGWYMLMGVWALPNERSRFTAVYWFGQVLGIIFGYTTSGLLCVNGFGNKWSSIFYVHGVLGLVCALCWWLFVYNSPRQHPRISTAEVNLIELHVTRKSQDEVPWCKIMSYVPCWAMFITHFCDNCIYYLCITCLPLYMKEILKFDIQSNGMFSSLPFLVMMFGTLCAGFMADFVRSKEIMRITYIRKMFQTIGLLGVATFIIIPGYLTCELRAIVIVCLCLCTFFESIGNVGGYTSVCVDMAPRYASVIFAISNSISALPGILAPIAVAELTQNQTSEEWRVVFFIAAGVSIFAALVFDMFSSSDRAPWAEDQNNDIELEASKPLNVER